MDRYGPHTACCNRFRRWSNADVRAKTLDAITVAYGGDGRMIESGLVRVRHLAASLKSHPNYCPGPNH